MEGDRLGIVGHNGAGKSTLLRALTGVYPPQLGSVEVIGNIGSLLDVGIGIVPEATGRQNVYYRGALMGLTKKEISSVFQDIVDFSELGDFIDMPVRTYSSGMNVRLAFAISTVIKPDILVMDEWLSVGDQSFVDKAEKRLQELVSNSKILVIASHSPSMMEHLCNKILWMKHGKVELLGEASDVLDRYQSEI
jgi:lipopolysaccharide transport system ATP-binding protein